MRRLGLTGGIGSGKSTVARLLAERGAVIVDADEIAREVVVPGGSAYAPLVQRFGEGVLASDGTVDRAALAAVAFADPRALADLNAITHPLIGAEMARRLDALDASHETVGAAVVVIPLLRAYHVDALRLGAVVVVDCPIEVAIDRLVHQRGMDESDARARIEAQPGRAERLVLADYIVDNSGGPEQLALEADALWAWVQGERGERGEVVERDGAVERDGVVERDEDAGLGEEVPDASAGSVTPMG